MMKIRFLRKIAASWKAAKHQWRYGDTDAIFLFNRGNALPTITNYAGLNSERLFNPDANIGAPYYGSAVARLNGFQYYLRKRFVSPDGRVRYFDADPGGDWKLALTVSDLEAAAGVKA